MHNRLGRQKHIKKEKTKATNIERSRRRRNPLHTNVRSGTVLDEKKIHSKVSHCA